MLNGKDYQIQLHLTGDYKFICSAIGHLGASSKYPCVKCIARTKTGTHGKQYHEFTEEIGREEAFKKDPSELYSCGKDIIFQVPTQFIHLPMLHILMGIFDSVLKSLSDYLRTGEIERPIYSMDSDEFEEDEEEEEEYIEPGYGYEEKFYREVEYKESESDNSDEEEYEEIIKESNIKINQKPTTLFTYHYNKSNGVVLGSGEFPILKSSIKNGPVSFDLMKNCGNFAKRGHEDMVKSMWSSFVKSKPNDKPIDLRRDLGGADIVTWRGFLKNIGLLGLNDFNGGLHILAQKYNNVIFLEEYPKPNKDKEDKIKDQTSQMEDHKGHMFENFITENANGKSNENNNVDTSDVCNIVQTRIFTYNGKNTTVCYTAKVGALKHKGSEQFVEATTCIRNANKNLNDTLYKNKGKKYWMQSYLVGIEEIVVGIKKKGEKPVDAYFVEEIQVLKVDEIRQKNRINPQQAMDYIAKTLNEIKEQFNDPDTKFVEISKAKNNDEIKYKKLPGDYKSPLRGAFPLEFREAYPEKN
uniref:Decapping nuclease n=1 Tax=Rhabditophanes sp. KR3021 TaxID=114890 RepID=A0AC35UFZ2_9BILA